MDWVGGCMGLWGLEVDAVDLGLQQRRRTMSITVDIPIL